MPLLYPPARKSLCSRAYRANGASKVTYEMIDMGAMPVDAKA